MKRLFAEHRQLTACQTFNDFRLRHLLVIFVNMSDRYILRYEGCADEFASVTRLWLPLTAHQDNRLLLREGSVQAFNTVLVVFPLLDLFIVKFPVDVTRLIIRSTTECISHEHVADAVLVECIRELCFGEFRLIA